MENLSLEKVEIQLSPLSIYQEQITKGANLLKEFGEIKTQRNLDDATELLNKAKKLTSLIDKEVEAICRPVKDWKARADAMQRSVKAHAEEVKQPISEPISELENKITSYVRAAREEREKQEAKQRAIQQRIEEITIRGLVFNGVNYQSVDGKIEQWEIQDLEFDFAAHLKGIDAAISKRKKATEKKGDEFVLTGSDVIPEHLAPVPTVMTPKVKGLTKTWKHEIVNPLLVPIEYCTPDPVKINAAIKSGVRMIAGVKIYEEETIRRTNV